MSDNRAMDAAKQFEEIFHKLDEKIRVLNLEIRNEGLTSYKKVEITLLGQVSLLVNSDVSIALTLTQTADLDALLKAEHKVKVEFKKILEEYGYVYDEDSPYIWIPPQAHFKALFDFKYVLVKVLDAESALVSKAVKAPEKNKILIREALAKDLFPTLADRIISNGGSLENFI